MEDSLDEKGATRGEGGVKTTENDGCKTSESDRVVAEEIWIGRRDAGLRRQPKLTEKGKNYKLSELLRERKHIKANIRSNIESFKGLMTDEENYDLVKNGYPELDKLFRHFVEIHDAIQPLLNDLGQSLDSTIYEDTQHEIDIFMNEVERWLESVKVKKREERNSVRFKSVSGRNSQTSKRSTTSSTKQKAIEAKARMVEMKARLDKLEQVETARKEAERAELNAQFSIAAAVNKVYEDALNEENEQYLGSDDPDYDDHQRIDLITPCKPIIPPNDDKEQINLSPSTPSNHVLDHTFVLNPGAEVFKPPAYFSTSIGRTKGTVLDNPELKSAVASPRYIGDINKTVLEQNLESKPVRANNTCIGDTRRSALEHDLKSKHVTNNSALQHSAVNTPLFFSTPKQHVELNSATSSVLPQTSLLEKMELRMSQPPPKPVPFDGDPTTYLRFSVNFKEQVESRVSLTDGEKMNYLLSYTSGKARQLIENYQGLPNACQLSLNLLHRRFGQTSMIVEALKSTVIYGEKLRPGDGAALLILSDKLENCCNTMNELNSNELNCTTNLKCIYDRLPDPLQRKWRKTAKSYRERNNGKEPTLRELADFIAEESQAENDPVYGHRSDNKMKSTTHRQQVRPVTAPRNKIATLVTPVQKTREPLSDAKQETPSQVKESCQLCHNGVHELSYCTVFLSKGVNWRRKYARTASLCYLCLSNTHIKKDCTSKISCNVKDCKSPSSHNKLLHYEDKKSDGNSSTDNTPVNTATMNNKRGFVKLKVVPVRVTGENGSSLSTYGLLDTAAACSMITDKLSKKLQLRGVPDKVDISTVTHKGKEYELPAVDFRVSSTAQDNASFPVYQALSVESLNVSQSYRPSHLDLSDWPHLNNVELPSCHVEVSVLIGQDVPQAHVVLEYVWGDDPQRQPYATKTPFGWCVAGPTKNKDSSSKPVALSIFEFNLENQVERFWSLERHGFTDGGEGENSAEDLQALEILKETTRVKDNRYEVGLLWKTKDPNLPDNRSQADKRFQQLKRRFDRDPEFASRYKAVMEEYINKGYAKRLSREEATRTSGRTWYLPHHGVVNPNKSKVRVVYDAAATYGGTSLNKELFQGPQLNNSLIGVLMRFRKEKIAVSSDIESMFHRVACREEDTDALRFLWFDDDVNKPPIDCKMMVHLFGKTDSPCIASWALKRTALDNEDEFDKGICDIVNNNFYVDDCLFSKPTIEEAVDSSLQLMNLLKKGNFRLTKFASSNKQVLASIPAEERTIKDLDLDKLPTERALGVQWNIENDTFGVKVSLKPSDDNTRRSCLSTLSSTFDPLGMVSPVLLKAKRVIQKSWQLKLDWDEQLPDDLLHVFRKWREELPLLNNVNIPRCYFVEGCATRATFQLHHFCDASEYGYGTVTYLRKKEEDGTVECAFVTSKSRTAPLQYVSIPRLELQAATIAVRVNNMVMKEIQLAISAVFFWTDSQLVIQYVNNESRRFKTYVANRVAEIRSTTNPEQWRHCPGVINPADYASRGLSPKELLNNRWFQGPAFLLEDETKWPKGEVQPLPDGDPEEKKEATTFTVTLPDSLHQLLVRYSSWSKLQRKVAWLIKFIEYLATRKNGVSVGTTCAKQLTPEDLEKATVAIVRLVQREVYQDEIETLKSKDTVKPSSTLIKLRPCLSNGIIRVGGRISEAPMTFDAKFPMIMPPKHHVSRLLISHFHKKLAHAGQNHILAHLRERFWIPHQRSAVRGTVRSCLKCKKQRAVTMQQLMAPLPAVRTTPYEPCFTHSGVDYFGPLSVKRGRAIVKRWGVIFTCFNSRAVHLEVASSLESDCFINVLRRFINRRGPPKTMHSDNGTNFVGAEREIKQAIENWNMNQVNDELLQRGCKWIFQPPKASHASGVWERLIRSIRTALKAILGESLADDDTLSTVFTEVESVLNSRPLCAISDDPDDFEPITPNHLLLQRPVQVLPPGCFTKADVYSRKKWRQVQILSNHVWTRWLKEYIPALQERQKWTVPRRNAEVGDLVLMVDECLPRSKWHLGRVTRVFPSSDGLVRKVEVKTKTSTFLRPIQKLCLLEEASKLSPEGETKTQ